MAKKKLRIIPLGGCGEIGKNMTVLEYGEEILIIDAGVMFPQNDMLGVDLIIPDWNYLEDKWDNVRGILITHGHEDHVGAIGHLMANCSAPIYATALTAGFVDVKLRRAQRDGNAKVKKIRAGDSFRVGSVFTVEPFHVTHSIPDCIGFGITTPVGLVVHTGDYKFDHTPPFGEGPDFAKLAEFSARGVLCLMADSTNSVRDGWTQSEQRVKEAFDDIFAQTEGRIIVTSFASLISRIQIVADQCLKHGRQLAIAGRSMRDNVKMARRMGYLDIPDDMLIDEAVAQKGNPARVTVMATGSQGEPTAVLGRLANGRHPKLTLKPGDTVLISAHTIPGNEEGVTRIINRLYQKGVNVLYEDNSMVHVSGHASRDEMKLMINLVRPKFLMPVHGELRHLKSHAELAHSIGYAEENVVVVENGTPVEFTHKSVKVKDRMTGGYIFVQGSAVGEYGYPMVRERERLAQAGFFMAAVKFNKNGELIGKPNYVSEGFLKFEEDSHIWHGVRKTIKDAGIAYRQDKQQLPNHVAGALARYFYQETGLRPRVFVHIE